MNINTLVNVYAPNLENLRINFYKKVAKWISLYAMNEENLIFVGELTVAYKIKKIKVGK